MARKVEIENAKIMDVNIRLEEEGDKETLVFDLVIESIRGEEEYNFSFEKSSFMSLMRYTNSDLKWLGGEAIRLVFWDDELKGIGHFIQDKFSLFGETESSELTQKELLQKLA